MPYISHASRSYLCFKSIRKGFAGSEKDLPIGAAEERRCARNGRHFVCICLYTDSRVVLDAQEVVYDLEALASRGVVCTSNVHHGLVLAICVVAEEGEDGDDALWADVDAELVLVDRILLDELGKRGEQVRPVLVQRALHRLVLLRRVDACPLGVRRLAHLGCGACRIQQSRSPQEASSQHEAQEEEQLQDNVSRYFATVASACELTDAARRRAAEASLSSNN